MPNNWFLADVWSISTSRRVMRVLSFNFILPAHDQTGSTTKSKVLQGTVGRKLRKWPGPKGVGGHFEKVLQVHIDTMDLKGKLEEGKASNKVPKETSLHDRISSTIKLAGALRSVSSFFDSEIKTTTTITTTTTKHDPILALETPVFSTMKESEVNVEAVQQAIQELKRTLEERSDGPQLISQLLRRWKSELEHRWPLMKRSTTSDAAKNKLITNAMKFGVRPTTESTNDEASTRSLAHEETSDGISTSQDTSPDSSDFVYTAKQYERPRSFLRRRTPYFKSDYRVGPRIVFGSGASDSSIKHVQFTSRETSEAAWRSKMATRTQRRQHQDYDDHSVKNNNSDGDDDQDPTQIHAAPAHSLPQARPLTARVTPRRVRARSPDTERKKIQFDGPRYKRWSPAGLRGNGHDDFTTLAL